MEKKRRLNVGLFINSLQNDYSTLVCKGAVIAAEELDVNLLIIPGRELKAQWADADLNQYEYQNNVIFSYITRNNIDVLIMSLGTFAIFLSDAEIRDFLENYQGIKIVIMEMIVPGYPCILFGYDGLRQEIEHIIKDHGKKKIAFFSGQKGQSVAESRLAVYRDVLAENDIPFRESYVEYGDFSMYCVKKARLLLERNKNDMPEAICCANDSMVIAVSQALEEKGLKVGKDIIVTGYDDAEFAGVMDPPLTTVKSNMMTMGHEAVKLAVKYYYDGEKEIRYVKTDLLKRRSCGCRIQNDESFDRRFINAGLPRETYVENIINHISEKSSLDLIPASDLQHIRNFIGYVYDCINEDTGIEFDYGVMLEKLDELLSGEIIEYFNINSFRTLFTVLKNTALEKVRTENQRTLVYETFGKAYYKFSAYLGSNEIARQKRMSDDLFFLARVMDEMVRVSNDEELCFHNMIKTLVKMDYKYKSCYIYLYQQYILNYDGYGNDGEDGWKRPENIFLKAYFNRGSYAVPKDGNQMVGSEFFMNNRFIDNDERKTYVLKALFFNEEQYGLMLLESDSRHLTHIPNFTRQLCTAIRMTRSMNLLESALNEVRETNAILSRESVSDHLTSLYNRRGFMIESEKILMQHRNDHCTGAVLFADIDNLKCINDTFGHKDGDFAIRKAASILTESLRKADVLGRIGGDEFVAFIMDSESGQIDRLCAGIRERACEFNKNSSKPYNVDISIGVYCFNPCDGETIDQLMTRADKILYQNKKFKNKTAIKSELK